MNQPLISIIMPAYNAAFLIAESLHSVKNQTYSDWELIVVEDASDDGTETIVNQFAQAVGKEKVKYSRHQQNQGISATRNTAMKEAKGEYIAFLDSDDLWKENHLETALNTLAETQGDLVYSTGEMFKHGTNQFAGFWGPSAEDLANFPASLLARCYIQSNTVVMRSCIIEKVGYFDTSFQVAEDLDYWLRVAAAGFKFIYIQGTYGRYRKKQNTSLTANIKMVAESHAKVLRKHANLSIVSLSAREDALVQWQMKAIKFNLKTNPWQAIKLGFLTLKISPQGSWRFLKNLLSNKLKLSRDNQK